MADNSAAKTHLDSVKNTLGDMRLENINNMINIINTTSLRLNDVLGGQNLLIDGSIRDYLSKISSDLADAELGNRVRNVIDSINSEISTLSTPTTPRGGGVPNNATRIAELNNQIRNLNTIADNSGHISRNVSERHTEYHELYEAANRFDLDNKLDDLNIDITPPVATGIQNLEAKFKISHYTGTRPAPSYELCDEKGDKLTKVGSDYQVTVGGQTYTLGGIKFDGNNIKHENFTINPLPATIPLDIKLSINASYPVNLGLKTINVTCNKKLTISLNDGTVSVGSNTEREAAFDDFNNSRANIVLDQLNTKIDIRNTDPQIGKNELERQALELALKYKGGTLYDTLSKEQKDLFYERICDAGFFNPIYDAGGVIDTGSARYDKMKAWFINESRPWNKDKKIIGSASTYKTYIHSNLDKKCSEYISYQLQTYLQNDTRNTVLKAELSKFLQEIDNSRLNTSGTTSEIIRILNSSRNKMDEGPRSLFHSRDVNYMRFFSGASTSLKNQKVNIYSDLNKPEPMEYDMDLSVSGKNNLELKIKIKGTDEIIHKKASQPNTLVKSIINDQRIKEDKVKAHICFNIYKAMIQIAQQKNISLTYRGMYGKMNGNRRTEETRKIMIDKSGNIVVKQLNLLAGPNSERDTLIFDQGTFLNKNEFINGTTNGDLLRGIETLGKHFNIAMNEVHKQYQSVTKKRLLGLRSTRLTPKLPTSKYFNRFTLFLNRKTNMNFDFNTTVKSRGKDIKIKYSKNKFTITMDGIEKGSISGKDLGKLLTYRQGEVRVFDGSERDISAGIYSCLIDNLRKNSKIARTNFGVVDDITGNMYILDEDGQFGMVAKEKFTGSSRITNPFKGPFKGMKKSGILNKRRLDRVGWDPLNSKEKDELLRNSTVMQRFINSMVYRMKLKGSVAAKI